jgi:hypothetical protein
MIEVAVSRGVLAVPFPGEVVVRLRRAADAVIGAKLELELTGADLLREGPQRRDVSLVTDARGEARIIAVPREHAVELTVRVAAHDDKSPLSTRLGGDEKSGGTWFGALPVVPGAAWIERTDERLRVYTPVTRRAAYVHLVRPAGESWLGTVTLSLDESGSYGALDLPEAFAKGGGFFAVVSSEPDTQSMALVGWPVGFSAPSASFDLRLPLIADGILVAREALTNNRARRASWALWSCAAAAALEAVLLLLVMKAPSRLGSGLGAVQGSVSSWVALICIAVAVLALGLFGLFTP